MAHFDPLSSHDDLESGSSPKPAAKKRKKKAAQADPYFVARDMIQKQTTKLTSDFARWRELFDTANTADSREFSQLTQQIQEILKALRANVRDVEKTIALVESHRERFAQIGDEELEKRRQFVRESRQTIDDVKSTLDSDTTKAKINRDRDEALRRKQVVNTREAALQRSFEEDNQSFVRNHEQVMQEQNRQQDEAMDDMVVVLKRLGVMGETIKVELEEQNEELEDIDHQMHVVNSRMDIVMGRMERLLQTKDRGKILLIVILLITLLLLMYFAFF